MSTPLLRIEDLSVGFAGRTVVREVSLQLAAGECLALVGESGSGKSVTARAVIGLAGTGAQVRAAALDFDGIDLRALRSAQWRRLRGRRIGYVLQDALTSLDPLRRIGHEIAEPLEIHRLVGPGELDDAVLGLLAATGIPDPHERLLQYPHELSGGLRQRALIASAVAAGPDLLIADEPTTALDATVQQQILRLLRERQAAGNAVLLISHDLTVVADSADTVAVMYAGLVVEQGSKATIFDNPAHPYTVELLASAPSLDAPARPAATARWSAPAATGCPFGGRCPVADTRCREELPPPAALGDGRMVRCWRPGAHTGGPRTVTLSAPAHKVNEKLEPALEFDAVTLHFALPSGGRRLAVDEVSLRVDRGDFVGLVGESGSGKSTLARLALAHLTPESGTVRFDGLPWSTLSEKQRRPARHRVQLIDQDPLSAFDPRYTVAQIIGEALARTHTRSARARRVAELLAEVGLDPMLEGRYPAQLSGGQRQRVAIARALAAEPELIVADEPVSALDVTIQAQILDLFARVQRETGAAMLFISHDLAVVRWLCRRVAVLHRGRIVESGSTEEVFARPAHPYTRSLLAPRRAGQVRSDLPPSHAVAG
ncbi:dipeptide ABC transporter ATP-binding protein [Nocardia salmonicida]|uniref:dipeptide ABC transporter ATP-binding protein n=1 Tax=Nocardia salmonicida TaxID=53431 RepID=UPI00363916EB